MKSQPALKGAGWLGSLRYNGGMQTVLPQRKKASAHAVKRYVDFDEYLIGEVTGRESSETAERFLAQDSFLSFTGSTRESIPQVILCNAPYPGSGIWRIYIGGSFTIHGLSSGIHSPVQIKAQSIPLPCFLMLLAR